MMVLGALEIVGNNPLPFFQDFQQLIAAPE